MVINFCVTKLKSNYRAPFQIECSEWNAFSCTRSHPMAPLAHEVTRDAGTTELKYTAVNTSIKH